MQMAPPEFPQTTDGSRAQYERLRRAGFSYPDVPVSASCPFFQAIPELRIGAYLRRGFIRPPEDPVARNDRQHRYLVGVNSHGEPIIAEGNKTQKSTTVTPYFSTNVFGRWTDAKPAAVITGWIPFSPLFSATQLAKLKKAAFGFTHAELEPVEAEVRAEMTAYSKLETGGINPVGNDGQLTGPHPLNGAYVFKDCDIDNQPRRKRWVPLQVQLARHEQGQRKDFTNYLFFSLPAFGLTGQTFGESIWKTTKEFQKQHPTTYISRIQIIYAALVYLWIVGDPACQPRPARWPRSHGEGVPEGPGMAVFIAYFPTYLKFHELHRLGAYAHPFDLVTKLYTNDTHRHQDFRIRNDNSWQVKFKDLAPMLDDGPFAFLAPAMIEGSALGGPFLPLSHFTLSEVHHYMGLGSIWTIGLPDMAIRSTLFDDNEPHLGLYAQPEAWASEFPDGWIGGRANFTGTSKYAASLGSPIHAVIRHVGAKTGFKSVDENPGWTSHLPARNGIICPAWGHHHDVSDFRLIPNNIPGSSKRWLRANIASDFNANYNNVVVSCGTVIPLSGVPKNRALKWTTTSMEHQGPASDDKPQKDGEAPREAQKTRDILAQTAGISQHTPLSEVQQRELTAEFSKELEERDMRIVRSEEKNANLESLSLSRAGTLSEQDTVVADLKHKIKGLEKALSAKERNATMRAELAQFKANRRGMEASIARLQKKSDRLEARIMDAEPYAHTISLLELLIRS